MVIVVQHTNNISHLHLHFSKPFNVSVQNCRAKATTIKQLQMNMNKMKKKKKRRNTERNSATRQQRRRQTQKRCKKNVVCTQKMFIYICIAICNDVRQRSAGVCVCAACVLRVLLLLPCYQPLDRIRLSFVVFVVRCSGTGYIASISC